MISQQDRAATFSPERAGEAQAKAGFDSRRHSLAERLGLQLFEAVMAVIGAVLRLGGAPLREAMVSFMGWGGYVLFVDKRRIARVNLDLVYGSTMSSAEKQRIVRAMFNHFVRLGLDFIFDTVYWPPEKLSQRVRVVGLENLHAAFELGRGVLCVSGHLGNWEIMCASAAAHGYDFVGVFKRPKGLIADRFVGQKRLRYGMSLLETPEVKNLMVDGVRSTVASSSIREDIEAVWRSRRAVAYLCDQRPRKRVMRARFLGQEDTATAGGLVRYAVANRVPLTLHHCVYAPDGNLVWTIEGPVEIVDRGGDEATTAHYVQLVNDWLSERIKQHPEQWTWGHRRFERDHYARRR